MKKYIVLSVNENPEYLFYLPLVCWAWRKFGWEPFIFINGLDNQPPIFDFVYKNTDCRMHNYDKVFAIDGFQSETITQISRLYAACVFDNSEDYLMTGDIDMLPLSDYWKFDEKEITVWGHDLTAYQHYPICYIGMPVGKWVEVMGLTSRDYNAMIKRDLNQLPQAKSIDPVIRWVTDQDLITQRLNATQFKKISVPRGTGANGYPIGRVDRSAWTLNQPQFIDAHLFRGIYESPTGPKYAATMELLKKIWPDENWNWFWDYCIEFKKLTNAN